MSDSSDDDKRYDSLYQFERYADHLNSINLPAKHEDIFYDIMSGGLVWRDETNKDTPIVLIWALRFLVAYRTSLMLNKPRTELRSIWEHAVSLFPNWAGFLSERREPTPKLLEIYRRGVVSTRKCIRDLEREMDAEEDTY